MHEKKTLTGLSGWDIIVGWFSGGLLFVLLWTVISMIFGRLWLYMPLMLNSAPLRFDLGIFLLDILVLLAVYALVTVIRRRYPYLAWSFGAGALPACIFWSLLADHSQYWRG